ncbi:hypothetical protein BST28_18870 [Mycolicibacter kumamotonensis]|uniref:Uncharacterized protein n=1 Tax=Mycolicibacter kumamotonensis TaxID=354243 RepID=A0A1X0DY56_9MYCO|nr:hypothetical protein [Mycolicibacter kumamotonensis]ORA77182.1 hypothetical protein BST28_18870 [Mycolicibacter kumamotonensis]
MTELPKAVIEPHRVLIDGQELPGIIADSTAGGVVVLPGGHDKLNRVQVTFCCGEVTVTDNGAIVKDAQDDE